MLLENHQLGRYRLIQQIGSGGMGTIFLAEDTNMPRQVAVKVVRTGDDLPNSQEAAQRMLRSFQREMRAIVQLDHPHILPVFDFGQETINDATYTYLVMLYRPEGSLSDWLSLPQNTARLSLADIGLLFTQAAQALQHAHTRGIVHQDVKPSNFLVRADTTHPEALPELLLADFGIARFSSATVTQSQSHNVRGTPMFMSPEQWDGRPVPASDQYALAIMAFRLLIGHFPFQGTMGQIMHHHYMMQPPVPSSLNPLLNSAIDGVILRALAKEPAQRFPDTLAFADAFTQAIREPEDLRHTLVVLTTTNDNSPISLSEQGLAANSTSTINKPKDAETPHKAIPLAHKPAAQLAQTPSLVSLNALASTVKKVSTGKPSPASISSPVGNDDATFIKAAQLASTSPGNDDSTFIKVSQTANTNSSGEYAGVAVTIPPAPIVAAGVPSPQTGPAKRQYTRFQKGLVIILLALVVLAGSGLLIYKNIATAKSVKGYGQNGAQAYTTITTSSIQTPAGTGTIIVASTKTPTTGQTPHPTGPNAPSASATTTSGTTSSATPTTTSGPGQQPTTPPAPQPTTPPAPRPTTPPPPPGCSVSSWQSGLRTQSNGGTVFHVTNYCQRTVSLRFTQAPRYTTDLQVCFGSDCSGWNSAPSSNVGSYIEFFTEVSVGEGFTINARCHGGATCPATYTVYGNAKY